MSHERIVARGVTRAGVITAVAGMADMLVDMRFIRNEGNEIFALGLMITGFMTAILSTGKSVKENEPHQYLPQSRRSIK